MTPEYTQARLPLWTLSGTESGPGDEYIASDAWRRARQSSPAIQEEEDKNNMKYLGHYSSGARVLLSSARPYLVPADFQGNKVRLPARGVQAAELGDWPVTTVSLPITDVYSAMERGTIDGSQGYLNFIFPYKQHEVAKHVVETGLGQSTVVMMMNRDVWESLSETEQEVFSELLPEFNLRMAQAGVEHSAVTREQLQSHPEYPTEVHQLNKQQRDLWDKGLRQAEQIHVERAAERIPVAAEIYRNYVEELANVEREVQQKGYPWDKE